MTLDFFEKFRENLEAFPDQNALEVISDAGRESFSYRRVGDEAGKIGRFLERSGIRPGDAVGILMENHPRWGIAFLAAHSAGAVIVPLDVLHSAETLAGLIRHAECKFLIVSQRQAPAWRQIAGHLPSPLPTLVAGEKIEGCAEWDAVLEEPDGGGPPPLAPRQLDDDLAIIYTSGTTGNPKGVVLTQRNVYRNVVEILKVIHARQSDHFLSVLPLYHVFALMTNFIIPLYLGARVTYLLSLEAQRVLKCFQEEGITIFVCVPQFYTLVYRRILQQVESQGFFKRMVFRRLLRLSRFANEHLGFNPGRFLFRPVHERFGRKLRFLGVGGARFDRETAETFRDLGFNLVQAFGMSETAALATVAPPRGRLVGTVGRPLPHTEIRIAEPDEHGIGEVLVRGENVMKGYLKNPAATAEALKDGWLHTGDLGYIDRNGCLLITGRKKDVIVLSSGKNIYPEEVEHFYLSNCPLMKEICVLGMPGGPEASGEERLHAVIVPDVDYLKANQIVNAHDAIRWQLETLSQRLPGYKRVHSFQIRMEPLPVTTTRKLKRFQIQKEVMERSLARAEAPPEEGAPETPLEEKLFEQIRRMKSGASVGRKMSLELDLGFTSLERVELLANVQEAFAVRIADEEAAQILTLKDLVELLDEKLGTAPAGAEEARLSWSELLAAPLEPAQLETLNDILGRRRWFEPLYCLIARCVRLLGWILFRLKFRGLANLPREYPFVICPNHASYIDPFVLACGLPNRVLRRLFFLGGSEHFTGRVRRFLGKLAKVVPISPGQGLQGSLRLAAEGLRRGMVLLVFPEGERSIDGRLKTFRKGPAILASELGAPIVPAGISGAYEVWRRGSDQIRLRAVSVAFGRPIKPAENGKSYDGLNARLWEEVRGLLEHR
jgi:long-chain acyl-CoA synthetase